MCLAMNSFIVLTALFVFLYLGTDLHFSLNGIIYILSNSGVSFATLVFIVVVFGLSSTFVSLIFSSVILFVFNWHFIYSPKIFYLLLLIVFLVFYFLLL